MGCHFVRLSRYSAVTLSPLPQHMPRAIPLPRRAWQISLLCSPKQNQFPVTYSARLRSALLLVLCVSCVKNWIEFIFLFLTDSLLPLPHPALCQAAVSFCCSTNRRFGSVLSTRPTHFCLSSRRAVIMQPGNSLSTSLSSFVFCILLLFRRP